MRRTLIVGIFLTLALITGAVSAQQNSVYDERTLTSLYEAYLKRGGSDAYLEKRIADERAKIRIKADQEVQNLIVPKETEEPSPTDESAVERQRATVALLQEELHSRRVDIDLLEEEERAYYAPASGTGATDSLRLTETHGELLAQKAILEERVSALEAALSLEQDRLSKLNRTQWFEQFKAFGNFFTYILIILGAILIDRIIRKQFVERIEEKNRRFLVAKVMTAGIYILTLLWIFSRLFADHPNALASLAIVGAGLAVALQDVVKDFVGWILILQRRLFTLGDRVVIGQFTGDIIDIGPLRTTMLEVNAAGPFTAHERTGKTLNVPNSLVLREPVLNYNTTSDFMSVEMQVTVTYDSDWRKAEHILLETLSKEAGAYTEQARKQQRRRTALFYTVWEVGEPEVHTDLAANGILFTLKFTVPIGRRRPVITSLSRTILERFNAEPSINLAYNTIHVVGGTMQP